MGVANLFNNITKNSTFNWNFTLLLNVVFVQRIKLTRILPYQDFVLNHHHWSYFFNFFKVKVDMLIRHMIRPTEPNHQFELERSLYHYEIITHSPMSNQCKYESTYAFALCLWWIPNRQCHVSCSQSVSSPEPTLIHYGSSQAIYSCHTKFA